MLEARPGFDAFLDGFKGTVRSGDIGFDRSLLAKHQYFSDHPKWSKKWSQNAVRIISVRRKPSYLWGTCWEDTPGDFSPFAMNFMVHWQVISLILPQKTVVFSHTMTSLEFQKDPNGS
jgi:hypothetical protein